MAKAPFKTSVTTQRFIQLDREGIEKILVDYFAQFYPGEGPFTIEIDSSEWSLSARIRGAKQESQE